MKKKHPKLDSVEATLLASDKTAKVETLPRPFHTIQTDKTAVLEGTDNFKDRWQDFTNYQPLPRPTIFDDFTIV